MVAGKPRVCWDSCVYISLLTGVNRTPQEMKALYEIEHLANEEKVIIFTSVVTIVEVLECKLTAEQAAKFKGLIANPMTPFQQVDTRLAELAHTIRSFYEGKISTPDAIHLATAIQYGATSFQTYDGCGKRKKGDLLKLQQPIANEFDIPITLPQVPPVVQPEKDERDMPLLKAAGDIFEQGKSRETF